MADAPITTSGISRQVADLFADFASDAPGPGLSDVLERTAEFAWVDRDAREIVIDRKALLQAVVLSGSERLRDHVSSAWVVAALAIAPDVAERLREVSRTNQGPVVTALEEEYAVVLSRSVRGVVVPRAVELAQATMGRAKFDLRHLVFALLEHVGREREWGFLDTIPTVADLARARALVVERIGRDFEPGENLRAWHTALQADAIVDEAEDRRDPEHDDRVRAQRDEPAQLDQLGRSAFADVIAARLIEVQETQAAASADSDRSFFIHLDGPWGSGKSTILNFVKARLRKERPAWLFVEFNAWREQKNLPPWWALMSQFVRQVEGQLSGIHRLKFRAVWELWNWRRSYVSTVLAVAVILLGLLWFQPDWTKAKWQPKDILALFTTFVPLAAVFRAGLFGSGTTAKAIEELRGDPYAPVMAVFKQLVACADRPILVIIDDIDRCDGSYVVTLLENIQTMLRAEPISYVVAGDRKWIVASFEKRYADFSESLGRPGRPLGHLFLDKLFQLSVGVPRMGRERRMLYWQTLLQRSDAVEDPAARREEARAIVGEKVSQEDLQQAIDDVTGDAVLKEEVRAEAARKITSPAAGGELESRYQALGALLEPNPRAMRRLINAIGLNQAIFFLEGRRIAPDLLGRWTVLEMRWPQLAEALASNRDWLDGGATTVPAPFDGLLASRDVKALLAGLDGATPFDRAALTTVLGDE